jgi:hypothetical protein
VEEADMECVVQGIIETQVSAFVSSLKFQLLFMLFKNIGVVMEYLIWLDLYVCLLLLEFMDSACVGYTDQKIL